MRNENHVFHRTEVNGEIISEQNYNLVIGLVLVWGFAINYLMVRSIEFTLTSTTQIILFIVGYFASFYIGHRIMRNSENPAISFIGYNFIVVPFGLIIDTVISGYSPTVVQNAMLITGIVTLVMMFLGVIYPEFFQKIQGALMISLIVSVVVQLIAAFIFRQALGIIDWIVALTFCGYIGLDWGRANGIPKTLDNAIDSAAALYIDIVNLFLRIVRILGRRD